MIALAVTSVFRAGHEAAAEGCLRARSPASRDEPGCRLHEMQPRSTPRASPHFERFGTNGIQKVAERRDAALYEPFG